MSSIQKYIKQALRNAKKKYELIAEGRNRAVFVKDDGYVIKVPLNEYGIDDCISEHQRYQKYGKDKDVIKYAECKLFYDENGIPILEMERVYPIKEDEIPEWADWVDCHQVGKTISGEIVAYDYAD